MYHNKVVNQYLHNAKPFMSVKDHDQLGINNIDFIRDPGRNLLILLITVNAVSCNEIYAFLKGSKLILESSVPSYNDYVPVRTHLVGREIINEVYEGNQHIGFAEISLKHGFHYKVLSYQVMKKGLLKVVLSCTRLTK